MARKQKIWPLTVYSETRDEAGKRHRMHRTVEGAGDAEKAMLQAVLGTPRPGLWLGVEIRAITPLGQKFARTLEVNNGKYYLRRVYD